MSPVRSPARSRAGRRLRRLTANGGKSGDLDLQRIRRALPQILRSGLPRRVEVASISEEASRRLNRTYRGRLKAANVLSFRYDSAYGEILICPAVIRRQARTAGHSYPHELTRMALHGMIHLAGLHHERSPAVADKVSRMEQVILRRLHTEKNKKSNIKM